MILYFTFCWVWHFLTFPIYIFYLKLFSEILFRVSHDTAWNARPAAGSSSPFPLCAFRLWRGAPPLWALNSNAERHVRQEVPVLLILLSLSLSQPFAAGTHTSSAVSRTRELLAHVAQLATAARTRVSSRAAGRSWRSSMRNPGFLRGVLLADTLLRVSSDDTLRGECDYWLAMLSTRSNCLLSALCVQFTASTTS